jgi:exodeoxyribonuclease V alpha subunit
MNVTEAAKTAGLIELKAKVKRLIFRNTQNNYAAVSFEILEGEVPQQAFNPMYPDSFVGTGIFMRIAAGQRFALKGKWVFNRKYGWQFQIEEAEEEEPDSRQGVIEYLSSGLFKGIGPKTAEKIVDTFGENTLDVIKNSPEKLSRVSGVSPAKIRQIVEDYKKAECLERLMLSLKPFNISTKKVVAIHQKYGDSAWEIIQKNPYSLCESVKGIGFRTADAIARQCGKSANDDFRIRSCIFHVLNEVAGAEGHVYYPFDLLKERVKKTLEESEITGEVNINDIVRVCIDMNNGEEIIIEQDGAVYLPAYLASEMYIARKLNIQAQTRPRQFIYMVDDTIEELERRFKIRYAEKQKEAFRMLPLTNFMVITGGPGTGKTTIIKGIIELYKKNFPGSKISLCAPTGRAAKRMEETTGIPASTIHRLLEYRPEGEGLVCGRNEFNPINADLIIIDECSMIDTLLFSTFLKAVSPNTTLVMVGDVDQLPSVGAGNVLKDIIDSGKVMVVRLNEIFRQEETSKIVINANKINKGETDLEYGDDFIFIEETDFLMLQETIKKVFRDELYDLNGNINEVQVITPFRKHTSTGVNSLNGVLQEVANPKGTGKNDLRYGGTSFRAHDKVMQYKNNYDKMVFNGDTGLVHRVNTADSSLVIKYDDQDEDVVYTAEELDEIQLAYATTIHKSQGCEYHTVIIPLTMEHKKMLQRNLIYTGVTRAREKVILVGDKKALNYAIKNNRTTMRFSKLKERL